MNLLNDLIPKVYAGGVPNTVQGTPGFKIPELTEVLTFVIRFFFVLAGIAALIMLLLGAFSWITSGGNKENVEKARDKIIAAIIGIILIVVVVSVIIVFEKVVFSNQVCFGISCPLTIPHLIQ